MLHLPSIFLGKKVVLKSFYHLAVPVQQQCYFSHKLPQCLSSLLQSQPKSKWNIGFMDDTSFYSCDHISICNQSTQEKCKMTGTFVFLGHSGHGWCANICVLFFRTRLNLLGFSTPPTFFSLHITLAGPGFYNLLKFSLTFYVPFRTLDKKEACPVWFYFSSEGL